MQRLYFLVVTAAAAVTPLVNLARAAVTAAGRMQSLPLEPIAASAEIGIKAVLGSIVCVVTAAAVTVTAMMPTIAPVAVISAIVTKKPI